MPVIPIKYWGYLVAILGCIAGLYAIHHDGYIKGKAEVQAEWDADAQAQRDIFNQQVAYARAKEAAANEKTQAIQSQYNDAVSALSNKLRDIGMRDARIVQGKTGVQVAGDTTGGLSGFTKGSGGTDAAVKEQASAGLSVSFADTMSDTLQCVKLQEWVTAQGM